MQRRPGRMECETRADVWRCTLRMDGASGCRDDGARAHGITQCRKLRTASSRRHAALGGHGLLLQRMAPARTQAAAVWQ